MPNYCIVATCFAQPKRDGVKLFSLPPSMRERIKWINFIGRPENWTPPKICFICSRHFVDGKPTAENPCPTIKPQATAQKNSVPKDVLLVNRKKRKTSNEIEVQFCTSVDDETAGAIRKPDKKKRKLKKKLPVADTSSNDLYFIGPEATGSQSSQETIDAIAAIAVYSDSDSCDGEFTVRAQPATQPTPVTQKDVQKSGRFPITDRAKQLAIKYRSKQLATRPKFSWSIVHNNDQKTAYYTGFPSYTVLLRIFNNCIKTEAQDVILNNRNSLDGQHGERIGLKMEDEFLMVLIKLRLNVGNLLLSDMFGVSMSQCGQVLRKWMPFLAKKFSAFVSWIPPNRRPVLPASFSLFPKCAAVIDCFEIRIQKPYKIAFSNFKNNETVKLLIALSPSGMIMYLSKPWGGKTPEEEIVKENHEFFEHLKAEEKGSVILMDKGSRHLKTFLPLTEGVMVTMPAISLKKGQRECHKETEMSRAKSNVRGHVERCFRQLRMFKILKYKYLMSPLYSMEDVLMVCAGITNLKSPLTSNMDNFKN